MTNYKFYNSVSQKPLRYSNFYGGSTTISDIICPLLDDKNTSRFTYHPILQGFQSAANLLEGIEPDPSSHRQFHMKDTIYHYNNETNRLIIIHPPRWFFDELEIDFVVNKIKQHLNVLDSNVVNLRLHKSAGERTCALYLTDKNNSVKFKIDIEAETNSMVARLIRIAQYLRDTTLRSVLIQDIKTDLDNSLTIKRIGAATTVQSLIRILQDTNQEVAIESASTFKLMQLKKELLSVKEIYAERVNTNKKYLGIFGLFGTHTAQEKLTAVTKFLEDINAPLDAAAKQGKLGELINTYQVELRRRGDEEDKSDVATASTTIDRSLKNQLKLNVTQICMIIEDDPSFEVFSMALKFELHRMIDNAISLTDLNKQVSELLRGNINRLYESFNSHSPNSLEHVVHNEIIQDKSVINILKEYKNEGFMRYLQSFLRIIGLDTLADCCKSKQEYLIDELQGTLTSTLG